MAYISPIEITIKRISEELIKKQEGQVLQAIYQQGITVNKEELIKALAYDRNQYEKGYEDGKNDCRKALKEKIYDRLMELKNGWGQKSKITRQELARADEISKIILALDNEPNEV